MDVTVVTPFGTSAVTSADQYTYVGPAVTGLSVSAGPTAGGTTVSIYGSNLTGATVVYFGSTAVTSFTFEMDHIVVVSPAGAAGTVDITVVTPNGTSATTMADQFTYVAPPVVTGVSPSSGSVSGGTTVTITGTGFTTVTAVSFGMYGAYTFTVVSDTCIMVTSPTAFYTGTVDITVVNAAGTSATSSADQFTYT